MSEETTTQCLKPAEKVSKLLERRITDSVRTASDQATFEKAILMWQAAAQAEKLGLEAENLRKTAGAEPLRFWVTLLAPLLAFVLTGITFIFSIYQFNKTAIQTRQSDETKQWQQTLIALLDLKGQQSLAGVYLLKTFFSTNSQYQSEARDIAVNVVLAQGAVRPIFNALFPLVAATTTPMNVNDLVTLSKTIQEAREYYSNSKNPLPPSPPGTQRLNRDEVKSFLQDDVETVGKALLKFMDDPKNDKSGLNLAGANFVFADLSESSKTKLWTQNLANIAIRSCSIEGADLTGVKGFEDSVWSQTAWWRASKMDTNLLNYLMKGFDWDAEIETNQVSGYFNAKTTEEEYKAAIERLRKG